MLFLKNYLNISTPFKSDEDRRLEDYKENKKKWIGKEDFMKAVKKSSIEKDRFISNFVSATPSDPPVNYNFRPIYKNKWIAPKCYF